MAVNNPTDPDPSAEPPDFADLPQATQDYIKSLRREAAGNRVENKTLKNQLKAVSGADEIADLKRVNGLLKHGVADVEVTEFLLRKAGKWEDLDPQADDFAETLGNRVTELIRERPELRGSRAMPTRSSSGSIPAGGPGMTSSQLTREQVKQMRPEAVEEAFKHGDLNQLLGRR
jgi:hypothetical protein